VVKLSDKIDARTSVWLKDAELNKETAKKSRVTQLPNDHKTLGALAVQMFIIEVIKRGGHVSQTIGDSRPYDVVIEPPGISLLKIQVKSCWNKVKDRRGFLAERCKVTVAKGCKTKQSYKQTDFDFAAIYLAPFNHWAIHHISELLSLTSISYLKEECVTSKWQAMGFLCP